MIADELELDIVIICGSHRGNGNTNIMLETVGYGALDIEKYVKDHIRIDTKIVQLYDRVIIPCQACNTCKGDCVMKHEDEVNKYLQMMVQADGLIIGAPVYFGTMPGILKNFLDRTRILRHNDFQLMDKPCGFATVAARRNGGQETTIMEMLKVMLRHGCIIVNNGPPTSQYGATGWAGPVGEMGIDSFGLQTARGLGLRVAMTAYIMKYGRDRLDYDLYRKEHVFDTVSGTRMED